MAQKIASTVANFETQITSKITDVATSLTLLGRTTVDGEVLGGGLYGMTINEGESNEEHIIGLLSATTSDLVVTVLIRGVSRIDGISPLARKYEHKIGAPVKLTNHPGLIQAIRTLQGLMSLNGSSPLSYDVAPTFNNDRQLVDKGYSDAGNFTKVSLTGNETVAGVKTFTDRPIFQSGFQSNTPSSGVDPVASNDLATKAYVLSVAFGGSLISGLNSPDVNYDQLGRVTAVHDDDNGKTYIFNYDGVSDVLRRIFDGTNTWIISYLTDGKLNAVSKH